MTTNERAGLTDNAWVNRINELRNDLEDFYSSQDFETYVQACEWMLDERCEAQYDLDDADFLRREAKRRDDRNS